MAAPAPTRLEALDVLRGLAVAGMLLVTMPGDWGATYAELRHADWNGWTLADAVFPAFLFGVGAALGLGFDRRMAQADGRRRFWPRALRRTALLIGLGLGLEATYNLAIAAGARFPGVGGLDHLRYPGILQRIALCYLAAAGLCVLTARRGPGDARRLAPGRLATASALILAAYAALLLFAPTPGFGAGRLDPVGALPAWLDRQVFGVAHLWVLATPAPGAPPSYDPEGLLSTLPAVANVLWGVLAAWAWREGPVRGAAIAAASGVGLLVVGLALSPWLPINKRLWTPSFALASGGVSLLVLAGAQGLVGRPWAAWVLQPLKVLGANAILAFVLATVLSRLSGFPWLPGPGGPLTAQAWGDRLMLEVVPEPHLAALACAIGMTGLITLLIWPLHRRGVHLRL